MKLNSKVNFFLSLQAQLKILHWQTKAYSRHIAFGETYDEIQDLIDEFVEVAMGKYDRFALTDEDKTITIGNLSDIQLTKFIKDTKNTLIEMSSDFTDKDTDLSNIRDEMLALVNKLSYLLTLE